MTWKEIGNYCYFNDDLEEELDYFRDDIVIDGNTSYKSFNTNNLAYKYATDEWYQTEDICDAMTEQSGKNWNYCYIRGYCQRDWNICYFTDEVRQKELDYIEDLYFGKYRVFSNGDYIQMVTDSENIEDVLDGKIMVIDGYTQVPKYKEV